ncbi:MAG: ribosomal protein S18-alanine N-acetyltransferase [Chloroflexi bacterium]|nr:ribosomal protein S18-alanine N-acetyltransferase [Chloroflexota bacterium]
MRGQSVMPYALRPMGAHDIDQVAAMEREAFPTLWPPTSYRRELKNRVAEYLVCVREGEFVTVEPPRRSRLLRLFSRRNKPTLPLQVPLLVGFVGVWYQAGDAHIVSIAVREEYRRRGLGELLLIGAVEMAVRRGQQVVTLEVRASNDAAQALYAKYGFSQTGLRPRYYADNHEDAVIMTSDQLGSAEYDALFAGLRKAFEERYGEATRDYL